MNHNPRDTYLAATVSTASPAQLLVMLCERLVLGRLGRRGAAGDPADERGEPDVADHPGDRDVVVVDLGAVGVHGAGQHGRQQHAHGVDLVADRGVGEHERPGQRLGEVLVALEAAGGLPHHVDDPVGGRVARDRLVAQRRVGALELAAERGDEQVDLRREVPVERAQRDVGLLGHRPHLHRVEAALGRQRDGGVEYPLAPVPLRGGAEFVHRQ